MLGKQKCRILKEIRQRIADENDIPYVTRECHHQGECRGTCPRCESELRELERQLAARQAMGKRVTVAALCAGLAFSSVGCTRGTPLGKGEELSGLIEPMPTEDVTVEPTPEPEDWQIMGEVAYDGGETESELTGDVAYLDPGELEGEPIAEDVADG